MRGVDKCFTFGRHSLQAILTLAVLVRREHVVKIGSAAVCERTLNLLPAAMIRSIHNRRRCGHSMNFTTASAEQHRPQPLERSNAGPWTARSQQAGSRQAASMHPASWAAVCVQMTTTVRICSWVIRRKFSFPPRRIEYAAQFCMVIF